MLAQVHGVYNNHNNHDNNTGKIHFLFYSWNNNVENYSLELFCLLVFKDMLE